MDVFNAKTVLKDGNCLFLSLAMLVKNDETPYSVLRRKVLIHVRDNGNNFEGPDGLYGDHAEAVAPRNNAVSELKRACHSLRQLVFSAKISYCGCRKSVVFR
jgi:hypothetical protein